MEVQRNKVYVLTTGGTIEKTYNETNGCFSNTANLMENFLENELRLPTKDVHIYPILCKDSLEMTQADRHKIFLHIDELQSEGNPIIVVHGTDTMTTTARYCKAQLTALLAPVIFTGAMKPIAIKNSDAKQNIAEALMICESLEPGVYISFHNQLLDPEEARKNYQTNTISATKRLSLESSPAGREPRVSPTDHAFPREAKSRNEAH